MPAVRPPELCEWDPTRNAAADILGGCPREPTVRVRRGKGGWRYLCATCVRLPRFRRCRVYDIPLTRRR